MVSSTNRKKPSDSICAHGYHHPLNCAECLRAKVQQLQAVILDTFSFEPDHARSSEGLDVIGHSLTPSDESRTTIIQVLQEQKP